MTSSNFAIGKSNAAHHATEMISFLWELIQCNKRFRRYLCETKVGMDYLVILLFYARDSVGDEMKQGVKRMAIFVIQSLSAEAAFNAKLNTPFLHVGSLPPVMRVENFHGSYADFLICVRLSSIVLSRDVVALLISAKSIHLLVTTSRGRLEPVYPALFNIIKNVAPYAKNLQRATSSKVMSLLEIVSAPSFCLKNDSNHLLLKSLLDGCNALLENHLRGKFTSISCPTLPLLVAPKYSRPHRRKSTSDLSKWAWRRPSWSSGAAVLEGYGPQKSSYSRTQTVFGFS